MASTQLKGICSYATATPRERFKDMQFIVWCLYSNGKDSLAADERSPAEFSVYKAHVYSGIPYTFHKAVIP